MTGGGDRSGLDRAPVRTDACSAATDAARPADSAQSSVVGVVLLLGATVLAVGVLTASVGTIVDGHAARADADRVASDLDDALRPVETTGHRTADVRFAAGTLRTVERELRVLQGGTDRHDVLVPISVGGLVYERGDRRVRSVAGALVRGRGEGAWTVDPPPVVGSASAGVLVVGAPKLNASDAAVGGRRVTATLATNVSHERIPLGTGRFAVAVETTAPAALERALRDRGASTVTRRHYDDDGVPSVVARFSGQRTGYLVVHDLRLEVSDD